MSQPQFVLQKEISIKKDGDNMLNFQNLFGELKTKEEKIKELNRVIKEIEKSVKQNKLNWIDNIPIVGNKKKKIKEEQRLEKDKKNKEAELKKLGEELKVFNKKEIEILKFELEGLFYNVDLERIPEEGNIEVKELLNEFSKNLNLSKANPLSPLKQEEIDLYNEYTIIKNGFEMANKDYDEIKK